MEEIENWKTQFLWISKKRKEKVFKGPGGAWNSMKWKKEKIKRHHFCEFPRNEKKSVRSQRRCLEFYYVEEKENWKTKFLWISRKQKENVFRMSILRAAKSILQPRTSPARSPQANAWPVALRWVQTTRIWPSLFVDTTDAISGKTSLARATCHFAGRGRYFAAQILATLQFCVQIGAQCACTDCEKCNCWPQETILGSC